MIRRILLLKFVSWVVLGPVLALAPIQHVRISGMPRFSDALRSESFELHYRASSGLGVLLTEPTKSLLISSGAPQLKFPSPKL
jgi:hypothetical protein